MARPQVPPVIPTPPVRGRPVRRWSGRGRHGRRGLGRARGGCRRDDRRGGRSHAREPGLEAEVDLSQLHLLLKGEGRVVEDHREDEVQLLAGRRELLGVAAGSSRRGSSVRQRWEESEIRTGLS